MSALLTMLSSLPANFSVMSLLSFSTSRSKIFADQAEDENVFALVLGRAAERFDGQAGDRNADVDETFVVEIRLDVVRIVKQDAAFLQRVDVVLVTVLVKRDEQIRFVAGGEHFAGADADLENRRAAGDRGRNRHVRHDLLLAATGEPREKAADGLDAVLRIAGEADDGVVNVFGTQIGASGCRQNGPARGRRIGRGGIGTLDLRIARSYRIAHKMKLIGQ